MRTSTYREIPYNFTSADDRLIIRQLFGESVWDDVEELRSQRVTGRSARLQLGPKAVLAEFDRWHAAGRRTDYVTLSGSGEPTMHTGFGEVLRHVKATSSFRTALLSNGSLFWMPEVRRDAAEADVVKVTLSAWDEESFRNWYDSPDYREILAHRLAGATCTSVLLHGKD